ncbi:hypothetical protein CK203_103820 [Vitis vinifera]|uniref:DUF4283 domain-containing protein n=1 Tax=Vitis vinifera TaxID=29760 RepID=A0A438CHU6_VITVI|nr:hypothetical protein CK203_103820 [Vitis vinifera]
MQKRNRALGIRSLSILNKAFLGKWYWRFFTKANSLWNRVIARKHGEEDETVSDLFICKAMCAYVSPRVVKFEANGGTWISITKRSRGFVVSVGFGKEELEWLSEHLKKVVELEASRGFIQKIRSKTRTHLMEICFNSRGQWVGSPKEGDFFSARFFYQAGRVSKETIEDFQVSKGIYRGCQSYADMVAEEGPRNGALLSIGKWVRAVICESKEKVQDWVHVGKAIAGMMSTKGMVSVTPISAYKGCFFVDSARRVECRGWLELKGLPFHLWDEGQLKYILKKWGRVTKVAQDSLKLVDLSKVKLWVEMLPNVVLPALLEVEDEAWSFTVAVSVTEEDEEDDLFRSESTHSRDELMPAGGCVSQRPKNAEGLCGSTRDNECYRRRPFPQSRYRLLGPAEGNNNGPTKPEALFKAWSVRAQIGAKSLGPPAGPIFIQAHETVARSSSTLQCAESSAKEVPLFVSSQGLVEARAGRGQGFLR